MSEHWLRRGSDALRRGLGRPGWLLVAACLGLTAPAQAQVVEDWDEHDADTEWWEPADWADQGYDNIGVWGDPEWTEAGDDDWYEFGEDNWYGFSDDEWYDADTSHPVHGFHFESLGNDWEYGWFDDDSFGRRTFGAFEGDPFFDEGDDWADAYRDDPFENTPDDGWPLEWSVEDWDDHKGAGLFDDADWWDTGDEGLFDIE